MSISVVSIHRNLKFTSMLIFVNSNTVATTAELVTFTVNYSNITYQVTPYLQFSFILITFEIQLALLSTGDWFQDPRKTSKSMDTQVPYIK